MPELMSDTVLHPPGAHVRVNDTRLWVEREGRGEPLLLLAGGPANSRRTLVFASNRSGSVGGTDIWISTRTPGGN